MALIPSTRCYHGPELFAHGTSALSQLRDRPDRDQAQPMELPPPGGKRRASMRPTADQRSRRYQSATRPTPLGPANRYRSATRPLPIRYRSRARPEHTSRGRPDRFVQQSCGRIAHRPHLPVGREMRGNAENPRVSATKPLPFRYPIQSRPRLMGPLRGPISRPLEQLMVRHTPPRATDHLTLTH